MLWMSVVSGYLVQHYSWRWMFIVEGLPAVLWAFIWWRLADDRPSEAKWLSNQEKQDLQSALDAEQVGIKPVKNYAAAFRSPKVIRQTPPDKGQEHGRQAFDDKHPAPAVMLHQIARHH